MTKTVKKSIKQKIKDAISPKKDVVKVQEREIKSSSSESGIIILDLQNVTQQVAQVTHFGRANNLLEEFRDEAPPIESNRFESQFKGLDEEEDRFYDMMRSIAKREEEAMEARGEKKSIRIDADDVFEDDVSLLKDTLPKPVWDKKIVDFPLDQLKTSKVEEAVEIKDEEAKE